MKQAESELEQFSSLLEQSYTSLVATRDALFPIRKKSWEKFLQLGLPTSKSESFKAVRLSRLFSTPYELPQQQKTSTTFDSSFILPQCQRSCLIFVNGRYNSALSNREAIPSSVVISSLEQAMSTYSIFLNHQWNQTLKEENDPMAAMNTALHQDGLFIYVPPKAVVDVPIQILHLIDADDLPLLLNPRLHVCVGANAELQLLTSVSSYGSNNYCLNQVCEMTIEENAKVKYEQIACNQGPGVWHFDALRLTQKRYSSFQSVSITNGCGMMRNDYHVALVGENAETALNGVCLLQDKLEAHTHVYMDHQAPGCRSHQLFKAVLDDVSRSSFEGKIMVRQPAQKTDAFQLNNNLLLSDAASANSKPNLEVFADDVKASHGATVGQLDEDQLFYLRARGYSLNEARRTLTRAFYKEITDLAYPASLACALALRAKPGIM